MAAGLISSPPSLPDVVAVISSRRASSTSLIVPSSSFSAMLPVKPSVTITSAAPFNRSRLSALPAKFRELSRSSACASSTSALPFSSSSPIERSRTLGFSMSRISSQKTAPMWANWSRCSARASAFAPASSSTEGPSRAGSETAIAGRSTPGRRRRWSSPAASTAPVFPAETIASASPSATARMAETSVESGFDRTASVGLSAISITSSASRRGRPPVSSPGGPTIRTSIPSAAA